MYSITCSYGKVYKGETCHPLIVRLDEHQKAGVIEKSGMADHIWKKMGNHLPLWDEVKIIGVLDALKNQHSDLLSRPNIETNSIWELIMKGLDKGEKINSGKKSYIIVVIFSDVRTLSLLVPKIYSELIQQDT